MIISRINSKIKTELQSCFKSLKNLKDRNNLKNREFSIITNHCMGGFIYHDLGHKFLSPTINLKIIPDDFIEFLKHLKYYLSQQILIATEKEENYPVGKLRKFDGNGYIYIYFVHYKDFNDAVGKWNSRIKRMNWNNIIVMMTARDGCEYSTLQDFENIDYPFKVCFTSQPYPEFKYCKHARLDNGKPLMGYISDMVNIFGKRAFECNGFNYIDFLNRKNIIINQ